jgi:hypothetical protein
MDEGKRESLLLESRDEMTGGFNPLQLWRDRQRILADPEIAARPRPALANAPVRYALALTLTPLLLVAWLSSLLVGWTPGEQGKMGPVEARSAVTIEVLAAELPELDAAQVKALAFSVRLGAEARALLKAAADNLIWQPVQEAAQRRETMIDWVARVRRSSLRADEQRVLIAQVLHVAQRILPADRVSAAGLRNVSEGGPLMQLISVFGLLLSAWIFGQTLRHDPRFQHAARAERFYLYYTSTRIFWFLPAQALAYGLASYASAAGDATMFVSAQSFSLAISAAIGLYLLAGARAMARALAGAHMPLPRHAGWTIGWRMTVATAVATAMMLLLAMLVTATVSIVVVMLQ